MFACVQEKLTASDLYEHVRDGSSEHDVQTMDAATESQQQMMHVTEADNGNDDNDDDADKPSVPPDIDTDIIQVTLSHHHVIVSKLVEILVTE